MQKYFSLVVCNNNSLEEFSFFENFYTSLFKRLSLTIWGTVFHRVFQSFKSYTFRENRSKLSEKLSLFHCHTNINCTSNPLFEKHCMWGVFLWFFLSIISEEWVCLSLGRLWMRSSLSRGRWLCVCYNCNRVTYFVACLARIVEVCANPTWVGRGFSPQLG